MAKRTASIDEERGPTHTVHASKPQETSIKISPEIPTATILSSPNFDLVEHRLQEMGLLVKRASTVTSTVYTTVPATTTLISSIFLSATSTTYATTTEIAYVTFTQTSSIIGSQSSQPGQTGTPISGGSSGQQSTPGQNSASGLSTGAKAGIGVASAAGSSIICVIIIIWWRWRGKKDDAAEGGPVGAAMASPVANDNKSYTSPQTQSPNYSPYPQHGQTYPQQNQGYPQHVSQEYNQNYQQYPQYNQGYPPHQQWEPPSLSPTSGPDPSAMPFEVGGQSMFPYEMPPDPSVHEMQSSPIMRVASPTRKPVGSGMGRM
jgi:hypothetical protein